MTAIYAGVDLGGTAIKAAVADAEGILLAQGSIPTESHRGPHDVLDRIATFLCELAVQAKYDASDVARVGLGAPGLIDRQSGTTTFLPNLPTQWRDVAVREILGKRLKCPVHLLNDARVATLGELHFGHGRDRQDVTMVFFTLGTGVGGGVVVDGKLRLGPLGAAGELGHQAMVPDGPRCGCGNRGCLETLASGPAIASEGIRLMRSGLAPSLHELVRGDADQVTTRVMAIAAESDESVRDAINIAATYVGIAAANIVTILHPDLIVLGGGVAELGDPLINTVKDVIRQRVGMFPTDNVEVAKSQLGEQAGVIGAIALAIDSQARPTTLPQETHD